MAIISNSFFKINSTITQLQQIIRISKYNHTTIVKSINNI